MGLLPKSRKHRCPDGTYKRVFRSVDEAFPLHIPGWHASMEANIQALTGAPAEVRAEYERQIQGLLYSLDDMNNSLMMTFRAVYAVYQSDPCDHSDYFKRKIDSMIDQQQRMTLLTAQLRALVQIAGSHPGTPKLVLPIFQKIVETLGAGAVAGVAELEIAQARDNAEEWMSG